MSTAVLFVLSKLEGNHDAVVFFFFLMREQINCGNPKNGMPVCAGKK